MPMWLAQPEECFTLAIIFEQMIVFFGGHYFNIALNQGNNWQKSLLVKFQVVF